MSTAAPMSSLKRVVTPFALLVTLALVGAGCANNSKDEAEPAQSGGAAQEADGGKIAGKPVDGPQKTANLDGELPPDAKPYTVKVETAAGKVGEPGQVKISVIPSETWHVNLEYPRTGVSVEVPEGVEVAKPKLAKDDALALTEEKCEFAVDYTAREAGTKAFTGEVEFAVCQDTACVPKTEKIAFELAVE